MNTKTGFAILSRNEIDTTRWDQLMHTCGKEVFYFSWYLDLVAPNWSAIVWGDYHAVFPRFVRSSKLGKQLVHPSFVESLSIISQNSDTHSYWTDLKSELQKIPHRFSIIQFPESRDRKFQIWKKSEVKNYPGKVLRRNLRKAEAVGFSGISTISVEEFLRLLKIHLKDKVGDYKDKHYVLLEKLIRTSLEKGFGRISAVVTERGVHAAQFYLVNEASCYLVVCFSDEISRQHSGLHFLLFSIFETLENQVVHFGGSNVPAIAEFNKNFGAWDVYYTMENVSFLPGPFKKLLQWL